MSAKLNTLHRSISSKLEGIEKLLPNTYKLTLVARYTGDQFSDADIVLTIDDDLKRVIAAIAKLNADNLHKPEPGQTTAFQARVAAWMQECFGQEISGDVSERNHRFLEESLELVQACGCTASEANQLVDYVFNRPIGEKSQEVGGVMVTLAALCLAQNIDMHDAGETELARVWKKIDLIRAKQAAKPKHSPLPIEQPTAGQGEPVAWAYKNDLGRVERGEVDFIRIYPHALGGRVPIYKESTPAAPAVPDIEKIMEQAQIFASAWSLVGGKFDDGSMMEVANKEKEDLRAMLAASPNQQGIQAVPDGYCIMPRELTAENGAKRLFISDFSEPSLHHCTQCTDDDFDRNCEECKGTVIYTEQIPVSWNTIKAIYKKSVQNLAVSPEQQGGAGS